MGRVRARVRVRVRARDSEPYPDPNHNGGLALAQLRTRTRSPTPTPTPDPNGCLASTRTFALRSSWCSSLNSIVPEPSGSIAANSADTSAGVVCSPR